MSEQPGRYQRSLSGMVGALLVVLLVIGAYVAFRALNRDELSVGPETVDYREAVGFAQDVGRTVVYPSSVPDGWRATSVDSRTATEWGIGFLAPDGFAGVRQSEASLDELLDTLVDENVEEEAPVRLDSTIATTWNAYSDSGGDLAYAAEFEEGWVLVYGSAPEADLRTLAERLTTEPLA